MGPGGRRCPHRIDGATMARAVAERVWRTCTPEAIERELSALWREIGERGPVAHAMMSNLIVFRKADPARRNGDRRDMAFGGVPVDDVAARHPSRVILIEDESRVAPIPSIVTMGRQLVFDSRRWRDIRQGVLALAPYIDADRDGDRASRAPSRWSQNVDLADVNWRRLTPVRR